MPFKEATFWYGTILFTTGIYFWVLGGDRVTSGIILTVVGLLMSVYAVVAHHFALPQLRLWIALLLLTWAALGYDIYAHQANLTPRVTPILVFVGGIAALILVSILVNRAKPRKSPAVEQTASTPKLVIHRANYAVGLATEVSVRDQLQNLAREGLAITVNENLDNLLPRDPAPGVRKRLDVEYSYGTDTRFLVSRIERPAGEIMRLVLPEDSEVKRLTNENDLLRSELETEKAKAKGIEFPSGPAIKPDAVQAARAGGLMTRAVEAESLAVQIENIWHLYDDSKDSLRRPLSAKALPVAWPEYRQVQLFRFRTIYQWHIDSVKELDSSFRSKAIDHGFPNEDEYVDVKRNLEEHAKLLRELAGALVPKDDRASLYAEKHRLEDELEALELPEPPAFLKDKTRLQVAMMQDVRPMTEQERYEQRKKELRIKRLREQLELVEEKLNATPKGA